MTTTQFRRGVARLKKSLAAQGWPPSILADMVFIHQKPIKVLMGPSCSSYESIGTEEEVTEHIYRVSRYERPRLQGKVK